MFIKIDPDTLELLSIFKSRLTNQGASNSLLECELGEEQTFSYAIDELEDLFSRCESTGEVRNLDELIALLMGEKNDALEKSDGKS